MQSPFILLFLFGLMSIFTSVYAQNPMVSYDVHVEQNSTPAHCKSWRGRIGPESGSEAYTMVGQYNVMGPGVRTCTGCAVNSQSQDCVCKACYDYFQ